MSASVQPKMATMAGTPKCANEAIARHREFRACPEAGTRSLLPSARAEGMAVIARAMLWPPQALSAIRIDVPHLCESGLDESLWADLSRP